MRNNIIIHDPNRRSLWLLPGRVFWLWVLLWVTGGAIVGGMTGDALYDSMIYGDYGGGAWIGGLAFILMLCGGIVGLVQGATAYKDKDFIWIVILRIIGGLFLSSTGSFLLFIASVILMRVLFAHVDKYIAKESMPTFVILSGLLIGVIAGSVLGILQGYLQEIITRKWGRGAKNALAQNGIVRASDSMAERKTGESSSDIYREEDGR